jgi:hypothetical protein
VVVSCRVVSCRVVSCRVRVVSCRVVSCRVVPSEVNKEFAALDILETHVKLLVRLERGGQLDHERVLQRWRRNAYDWG